MLCDSFRLSWVSISIAIVDCEIQNCWCSVATSIMHWLLRLVFCTRQRHKFIIYLMSTLTIKKMPSTLSIVFIYVQPETKKSVHVLDAWQKPHEPPEFRNKSHWTTNNVLLNMTLQICISLSCLTHPLCVLWLKFQFSMLHSANGTAISRKNPKPHFGATDHYTSTCNKLFRYVRCVMVFWVPAPSHTAIYLALIFPHPTTGKEPQSVRKCASEKSIYHMICECCSMIFCMAHTTIALQRTNRVCEQWNKCYLPSPQVPMMDKRRII